jgi:hypothetical protein
VIEAIGFRSVGLGFEIPFRPGKIANESVYSLRMNPQSSWLWIESEDFCVLAPVFSVNGVLGLGNRGIRKVIIKIVF